MKNVSEISYENRRIGFMQRSLYMWYMSIKYCKSIGFFGFIIILCLTNSSLAQNKKNSGNKRSSPSTGDFRERTLRTDKFNNVDVCQAQILIKISEPLLASEIKLLKTEFKKKGLLIDIESLSPANIYLIQALDNKVSTSDFFQVLQFILNNNRIFGDSQKDAIIEPNYLIHGQPDTITGSIDCSASCHTMSSRDWGLRKIKAPQVWYEFQTTGDKNNVVAILDHGVDYTHDDLKNNLWKAQKPFKVSIENLRKTTCPAGTHGVDFWALQAKDLCNPFDRGNGSHGTKAAGIIGANGKILGVNKNIRLLPIRVLNRDVKGCVSNVIRGWEFIIRMKKEFPNDLGKKTIIVNNSYSFDEVPPDKVQVLKCAVQRTISEGLLLIASAGNDNGIDIAEDKNPRYPASISSPNLIAVAATDENDIIIPTSNIGPKTVQLAAPGKDICTTVRLDGYNCFNQTSAAAAFVSGAAALLLSACPELTNNQIKRYLEEKAFSNRGALNTFVVKGRVDIFEAVKSCRKKELHNFNPVFTSFNISELYLSQIPFE
jgi:hypothetical protein